MCDLRTWLEPMGWLVLVVLALNSFIAVYCWADAWRWERICKLDRDDAAIRTEAYRRGVVAGRMKGGEK